MTKSLSHITLLILLTGLTYQIDFIKYLNSGIRISNGLNLRRVSFDEPFTPIDIPQSTNDKYYTCNLLDFRNHWACNLQGLIIAPNFTIDNALLNNTNLPIDSYSYVNIYNITIFEAYESNIIVPFEYIDFFFQHYFNSDYCSKVVYMEQTKVNCQLDKMQSLPSVIFFMKDFGIVFHEDYPPYFTSFTSKFIFRKGIDHWTFGNELIKNYTIAVNQETKIVKITSNNSNPTIIPFQWPTKKSYQRINLFVFISIVLFIGLLIVLLIKRKVLRWRLRNQHDVLNKEISNSVVYQMYLSK